MDVATMESQPLRMNESAERMMETAWDAATEELRPKSITERRSFLDEMRTELENDSDDAEEAELNDEIIKDFIREMNKRRVYFE